MIEEDLFLALPPFFLWVDEKDPVRPRSMAGKLDSVVVVDGVYTFNSGQVEPDIADCGDCSRCSCVDFRSTGVE